MTFTLDSIHDAEIRDEFAARRAECCGLCYCKQLVDSPCDFCSGLRPITVDAFGVRAREMTTADLLDEVLAVYLNLSNIDDGDFEDESRKNCACRMMAAHRQLSRRLSVDGKLTGHTQTIN